MNDFLMPGGIICLLFYHFSQALQCRSPQKHEAFALYSISIKAAAFRNLSVRDAEKEIRMKRPEMPDSAGLPQKTPGPWARPGFHPADAHVVLYSFLDGEEDVYYNDFSAYPCVNRQNNVILLRGL
ncbi:MAG: hypothetical protein ACI4ML_12205 [Aristaeellaceae bacterium]